MSLLFDSLVEAFAESKKYLYISPKCFEFQRFYEEDTEDTEDTKEVDDEADSEESDNEDKKNDDKEVIDSMTKLLLIFQLSCCASLIM